MHILHQMPIGASASAGNKSPGAMILSADGNSASTMTNRKGRINFASLDSIQSPGSLSNNLLLEIYDPDSNKTLATAGHQGWSANLFTITSDCFPRAAVGSVVGLGGLGGAIGGVLVQPAIGIWLDFSKESYGPLFVVAGSMYLLSLLIIHLLLPRFEQPS